MFKLKKLYFYIAILIFSLGCQSSSDKLKNSFLPPEGKIFTFLHEHDYAEYLQQDLPKPYGVVLHSNLFKDVTFKLGGEKMEDLGVLIDSLDNEPLIIMLRMANTHMTQIIDGKVDSEIGELASTLKSHKKNIFLSIGYEVNNPRYMKIPIGFSPDNQKNLNLVPRYVKAHRLLVKKMRQNKISNVAYGWHVIGMRPGKEKQEITLESCYPGDDYVDWVGLTVYNISPHHYTKNTYFGESIFDEITTFAANHGDLPILICESSSYESKKEYGLEGDSLWADWYEPFFEFVERNNIYAISHVFGKLNDVVVLTRWREKLQEPRFILAQ